MCSYVILFNTFSSSSHLSAKNTFNSLQLMGTHRPGQAKKEPEKQSRVLAPLCFPSLIFLRCESAFKCYQNCLFKGFPHAHKSFLPWVSFTLVNVLDIDIDIAVVVLVDFCAISSAFPIDASILGHFPFPFPLPCNFHRCLYTRFFSVSFLFFCGTLPGYAFSNSIRVIN